MTDWEPATEAEAALRDALRSSDQQLYFRILSSIELLLPISAPAVAGSAPVGWGTWTTGGRTHVLAFTSVEAMRACLGEHGGSARRTGYAELATGWPNHEWWLAVNPGLPIEGYLPAWYVAQLSRGDVRLPGRTVGARARLERVEALSRSRENGPGTSASPAAKTPTPPAPAQPRPATPTPVVPAAFQLPEVPVAAPVTRPGVPGQPGGRVAAHPGGAWPDGQGNLPPRQPMTARGEATARSGQSRPVIAERAGAPANGQTAEPAAEPPTRRSFFEPASSRTAHRGDRLSERATPPSRFARGGQPFPRRGSAAEPAADGNSRAFDFTQDTRTGGATRPDASGEATQPLRTPVGPAQDRTQPLRFTGPTGSAQGAPSAADSADLTQALPRRQPTERDQEVPSSVAEPVSGPPASRRGFTPIVIEGTIIEARDLTAPPATPRRPQADRGPEPQPTASAAGSTATSTPETPAAEAEPTAPIFPAEAEPTAPIFPAEAEPTAPIFPAEAEPTAPIFPAEAEPTTTVFPAQAEPTVAISLAEAEPTVAVPTVPDEVTAPLRTPAPEPASRSEAVGPDPVDPPPAESTPAPPVPPGAGFEPANEVEEDLLAAAGAANTDTFLSTLLLAWVLMPVAADSAPGSRPGDPGYVWPTVELDDQTFVVVYTSPQRLADHADPAAETMKVRFVQLIRSWPDLSWSFAVNPGTPVGAKLPGEQIVGLANWAAELGLGDEREPEPSVEQPASTSSPQRAASAADPTRPIVMQKAIAPSQLGYYLERGYDRVSGFVHRASELAHLTTPAQLYRALGLSHPESPFAPDAEEIYVLRWPAYRPSLYRIPYGGQNEAAMRAMEGWVIERPPFRGNGFAPGESSDVLAEFKVDSVRLPHGAQLLRLGADGTQRLVAVLDADTLAWREVGGQ